jgi:hypothetical protein
MKPRPNLIQKVNSLSSSHGYESPSSVVNDRNAPKKNAFFATLILGNPGYFVQFDSLSRLVVFDWSSGLTFDVSL